MRTALIAALIAAASLSGCATKEFVLEEAGKVDRRVAALEQALAEAKAKVQERLKKNDARLDGQDAQAAAQGKQLTAVADRLAQTDKAVAEHAQRLQRVRVDVSSLQGHADTHGKQLAGLQTGLEQARGHLEESKVNVQERLKKSDARLDAQEAQAAQQGQKVDTLLTGLDASKQTLIDHAQRLRKTEKQATSAAQERATLSATTNDALVRANAAGKLAEGKLMYASVLNHEMSGFKLNHGDLGDEAKAALKDFADKLKAENANVYLEIQGHTDTSGKAETNRLLSQHRAEAVRDFLYAEGGIPLHRMAVFAYGGTRPVADNKKREGRVQNRRVMIIVLK